MSSQPLTTELVGEFQQSLRLCEMQAHNAGLTYQFFTMAAKRQFIIAALDRHRWMQSKVSRELKMHRNTLSRTMEELKITVPAHFTNGRNLKRGQHRGKDIAFSLKPRTA